MRFEPKLIDIIVYALLAFTLTLFYLGYTTYPYGWLFLIIFIVGRSWLRHKKQ